METTGSTDNSLLQGVVVSTEGPSPHQLGSSITRRKWFYLSIRRIGLPLALGQLLAGLIAVTAICSTFLANINANLPLTQNILHYCLLAICYVLVRVVLFCRHRHERKETASQKSIDWPRISLYLLAGLVDTHANWSVVAAYRFTTVTSIQLLDCSAIPAVMLLCFVLLRYRFFKIHYFAVCVCLIGASGMVATDALLGYPGQHSTENSSSTVNQSVLNSTNIIVGDILVIVGSIAYAFSNVLQQYLVIRYGFIDFLGYASLVALVPTVIYSFTFEREQLFNLFLLGAAERKLIILCFSGYAAAMFALYSLMPFVLARSNAILVNLSLLTADVYALLVGVFLFKYQFHAYYLLCFVVILLGVVLFTIRPPVIGRRSICCKSCLDHPGDMSTSPIIVVPDLPADSKTQVNGYAP